MPGGVHICSMYRGEIKHIILGWVWILGGRGRGGVPVNSKINYKFVFTFILKSVPVCKCHEHNFKIYFCFWINYFLSLFR